MRQHRTNQKWITAAFCLLTMLSAFTLSSSHISVESSSEVIELENIEEAVPVRRVRHRRYDRIALMSVNLPAVKKGSQVMLRARSERDQLNGIGGFLTT